MKRLLFITLEYPPQKGGVASYYGGLVEELKRQGYVVEVISNTGAHWHNPSQPPLTLRGGDLLGWIWPRWLRAYRTVCQALKKNKYDLLFVGQVLPLGTVAYLLRQRVPYVVFTHGMDVLTAQRSRRKRWLTHKILAHAKLVVANSEFTKDLLTAYSLQLIARTAVVYPCPNIVANINHEEVEVLRRRLGLTGKKVLLTLGRVVERKGHDLVIKALPEILKHVPEVVYVVAGVGEDLGRLGKMVEELKLQTVVRFVGKVSEEEKLLYYALCDLFVMPSRQTGPDVEGFGLSFLEAAMFGKSSVGGRSGGIPEAILDGKTGALVDPSDASALARVVVQLLRDDGLRHELGQNAKARVIYEFRWERQAEKLIRACSK